MQIATECESLSSNLRQEQDNHHRTQQLYNDLILTEKQYRQKIVKLEKELKEKQYHSRDEIDLLQALVKTLQKQCDQLTHDNANTIEQIDRHKNDYHEHEQRLQDDIQRLKRDLGLELYRKQDAEKKTRALEEKLRLEQSQGQKTQFDFAKAKHDLKTLQVKYDALQLEMIDVHRQLSIASRSKIPTSDGTASTTVQAPIEIQPRVVRAKRRTNDESSHEQEAKKPKRLTRSRSGASSATNTSQTEEPEPSKRSKRVTRDGSTASAKNQIPILIKPIKKKSFNVSRRICLATKPDILMFIQEGKTELTSEAKAKPRTALIRGRTKKTTLEPATIPVQQQSPSPTYATIERDTSLDRASFATIAVNASTVQAAVSLDTVHTTPKPSTFKRIQSLFRPSPSNRSYSNERKSHNWSSSFDQFDAYQSSYTDEVHHDCLWFVDADTTDADGDQDDDDNNNTGSGSFDNAKCIDGEESSIAQG